MFDKKIRFIIIFLVFCQITLYSDNIFERAEDLFLRNRPLEALPLLETVVSDFPLNVQAYLYLGIVYQQLGRIEDAKNTYLAILPRAGAERARAAFNLGNVYFAAGEHEDALHFYTEALEGEPLLVSALLNRANTLIKLGAFSEAADDYERYLEMDPESPQRQEIEGLVAVIREEEAAIAAAAAAALAMEIENIMTDIPARPEISRRQRFIEGVVSSLSNVADDIKLLSAASFNFNIDEGNDE